MMEKKSARTNMWIKRSMGLQMHTLCVGVAFHVSNTYTCSQFFKKKLKWQLFIYLCELFIHIILPQNELTISKPWMEPEG